MVAWPRARQPVGSQNARRYLVVMGVFEFSVRSGRCPVGVTPHQRVFAIPARALTTIR
ncbi:MAG: hypothetical protein ACI9SE_002273 [Neolewinella sp.]|jgi:hypothetical protein